MNRPYHRYQIVALMSLVYLSPGASAAPSLQRIRGTIESVNASSVTVRTSSGVSQTLQLKADTHFAAVVPSSLNEVGDGKFIGAATKGDTPPTAIEVVIFPAAMKGTGEGHYDWDAIHDPTAKAHSPVKSSMTNGTVMRTANRLSPSSMTNGTIKEGRNIGDSKKISVAYDNGKTMEISVPPTAPIVAFKIADKAILKPGAKLFSIAAVEGGELDSKLLAVGQDGLTPPM